MRLLSWLCVVALSVTTNAAEASTVVYDTMTGRTFTGGGAYFGYSPAFATPSSTVVGDRFTSTADGYISALSVSIYSNTGSSLPTDYALSIYADNGGQIGAFIEALSVSIGSYNAALSGTYTSGSYSSGSLLSAGQTYWIVAGTGDNAPFNNWSVMDGTSTETMYRFFSQTPGTSGSLNGGSYGVFTSTTPLGLMVTVASPVPLPAAAWLLLSGLGALGAMSRRHRAA
jgi:hypothetical protein